MAETITAIQVASSAGLESAAPPADPEMTVKAYVDQVIAEGHLRDGVRLLAHVLPHREAIWWAWSCVRKGAAVPESAQKVGAAVEAWIADPSDANRRSAFAIAQEAGLDNAVSMIGSAIFFSGGSISVPNQPEVPPPPGTASKLIAGSILVAAVFVEPEKQDEKLQGFLKQGLEVGKRIKLWGDN